MQASPGRRTAGRSGSTPRAPRRSSSGSARGARRAPPPRGGSASPAARRSGAAPRGRCAGARPPTARPSCPRSSTSTRAAAAATARGPPGARRRPRPRGGALRLGGAAEEDARPPWTSCPPFGGCSVSPRSRDRRRSGRARASAWAASPRRPRRILCGGWRPWQRREPSPTPPPGQVGGQRARHRPRRRPAPIQHPRHWGSSRCGCGRA
mmetsp:Transcript_19554/g.55114  ORF Transcript_19554/g.55114 Transcript_19554/m.55114 type:complete len:209 (+) Transcript_19554:346-972(+)